VIAIGLPASPGAAVGQVVFTADDAEEWHAQGKSVILVFHFLLYNQFSYLFVPFLDNLPVLFYLGKSRVDLGENFFAQDWSFYG